MSKQKLVILSLIILWIIFIWWWFLLASSLLWNNSSSLQNTIITPPNQNKIDTSSPQENNIKENLDTIDNLSDETEILTREKKWKITIALPPFIQKTDIQELTDKINTNEDTLIEVKIVTFNSIHSYKEEIKSNSQKYDLILVPSLRLKSFDETLSFPFQADIASIFHPNIWEIVTQFNQTWIPFSIDPFLTVSSSLIKTSDSNISRIDIEKHILKQVESETINLWYGISSFEKDFISTISHPLPWYLQTFEMILASSLETSSENFIFQLFNTPFWKLKDILEYASTSSSSACKEDVFICLRDEKKLDLLFTSLSKFSLDTWYIYPLPDQFSLTAQVRGFMSPNNTWNKEASLWWILWYLQEWPTINNWLRKNTLPAFWSSLDRRLLESKFKEIKPFIQENSLSIPIGYTNNLETWLEKTPLKEVINWDYNMQLYIEKYWNN